MGALPTSRPMTVAEFELLAEQSQERLELIDGEVIERPMATARHREIQYNIYDALKLILQPSYRVAIELEFRTAVEHSLPRVDVAGVSRRRFKEAASLGYLAGAPELVIEVLSPSNNSIDVNQRRNLCFANGAQEFWIVDPIARTVQVWTPDAIGREFKESESISSSLFGAAKLPVSQIFA